ncbi:MAG: MotA/TolQ/ExbB proton channel family protein [Bacteroidales bacterium]|jgi:biopolymer transport protein ExbB|nr:MotA/TolQ/ExbB proton channel family protein [Bacteroidales bacterium]MDY0313523.1 MotA/TolQ/ExbB proton channel family protein [Bacteroidales bacterium]NLB85551.1 MotA/TolQ/ExbB proton channel family protein [Bacteroidales bacterium]
MKKLIALLTLAGMLTFVSSSLIYANDNEAKDENTTEQVEETTEGENASADETYSGDEELVETPSEDIPIHQSLKIKFIEGGPMWMAPIIIVLILGLALAFERIIYLNFATTNTKKLLLKVEEALNAGGVEAAKEVCRNTRGPVASIFYQGLDRFDGGIDIVEKSVISYGGVQMGLLEKNLTWISLFIAIAPMLGFLGTVIGMIQAFDEIQIAGDINPSLVAGGMKVALITTVGGLIVAMILQVFYNYILGKIDGIVNSMEDASISLIDILVEFEAKQK